MKYIFIQRGPQNPNQMELMYLHQQKMHCEIDKMRPPLSDGLELFMFDS